MAKLSSKNAVVLVGGYSLAPDMSAYQADKTVAMVDVTGFTEQQNFTPGVDQSVLNVAAYWNSAASRANAALQSLTTPTNVTLIPEGYTLGNQSISMYALQANWSPNGAVTGAALAGTINFYNQSTAAAIEFGWALAHGAITDTTTGTGFVDPTGAAVTAACSGTLHIWEACASDTYVVKIQHCATLGGAYADLVTFTLTGAAIGSERVAVASGTIQPYRRVLATRTGAAGDSFGFSVHFWHA